MKCEQCDSRDTYCYGGRWHCRECFPEFARRRFRWKPKKGLDRQA